MSQHLSPTTWVKSSLGEIGAWGSGGTPKRTNPLYYGGSIPWLVIGDLNDSVVTTSKNTITEAGLQNSSAKIVDKGTLLIAMYGSIGKLGITGMECSTNQAIASCAVNPAFADLKFVFSYLLSQRAQLLLTGKGGAQQNISQTVLKAYEFPIPPLTEQKVIANKLDTLLAQVENTKARLERIPQILKRFRQSVLAAAVSGRLTEEWRETNQHWTPWESMPFAELLLQLRSGAGNKPNDDPEGTPILRSSAVRSMEIDFADIRYLPKEEQLKKDNYLKTGDLLFTRLSGSAEYVGNCAMVRSIDRQYQFPDRLFCARLKEPKQARFLEYFCASQDFREHIQGSLKSSAGHQRITLDVIKSAVVVMPSLEEQTEIVRRVDQLLAHADRIEQQVNNALARVNNLTQSILAKAFRGELTAQWRRDNPELISGENSAEALLERIKAERAAVAKPKRRKTKA